MLNTPHSTIIITESVVFEYPKQNKKNEKNKKNQKNEKNQKNKEVDTVIVNKYSNAQDIINTVNNIRKLKKKARGIVQERARINQPCKPCLPDEFPSWNDLTKRQLEKEENEKKLEEKNKIQQEYRENSKNSNYEKLYDF